MNAKQRRKLAKILKAKARKFKRVRRMNQSLDTQCRRAIESDKG